jgi:Acyl-coenzyme A:6-aminopenicillanic acid acyl-transferase
MYAHEKVFFEGTDSFMTVRHLTIRGTNFEIGQQLGKRAIERYGYSPERYRANPLYAKARKAYFRHNYPIHSERVRGVAAAFGLDASDDRYDLTALFYNADMPLQAPGCSVVYYPPATTASGGGYLSRNYDFSIGTMADLMRVPMPPEIKDSLPAVMSEPYIMEWYPEDGGYASLAIHAFDTLSGTLDGMNSAGLAVSIMADEEAIAALGPKLEPHLGSPQVIGLHELQVMRWLLDTCATVTEAEEALLTVKQHYVFIPCHYIVADKAGRSFVYENSTGRNTQYLIEGNGTPQVATNFQLYQHPTPDQRPGGALTLENNAFWRYQTLVDRIAQHPGLLTTDDLKANHACVNVSKLLETLGADSANTSVAAGVLSRTLWHSLYDQSAGTVEVSFYLGEDMQADGTRTERRSEYLKFALEPQLVA